MDFDEVVDVALVYFYAELPLKDGAYVSGIFKTSRFGFNNDNCKLICDKLKSVPYFGFKEAISEYYYDLHLTPNGSGAEFTKNHVSYSSYVKALAQKESQLHQAIVDSANASKVSAWSAAISAVLTLISVLFGVYQFRNSNAQDRKIDSLQSKITSLESSKILTSEQLSNPRRVPTQKESVPIPQKKKK